MADKKISELTALATLAAADLFAVVDNAASETKKITWQNLYAQLLTDAGLTSFAAEYIVLGSNAPAYLRTYAALLNAAGAPIAVCDASGDEVEINAAIAAVGAVGGGKVLLIGRFVIDNAIELDQDSIILEGVGYYLFGQPDTQPSASYTYGTVITLSDGANCNGIEVGDITGTGTEMPTYVPIIRNLALHGYRSNQTAGSGIVLNAKEALIKDCYIGHWYNWAIDDANGDSAYQGVTRVDQCHLYYNNDGGFRAQYTLDNEIKDCNIGETSGSAHGYGIYQSCSGLMLRACHIWGHLTQVYFSGGKILLVNSTQFDGILAANGTGLHIDAASNNCYAIEITGNHFWGEGGANTGTAIEITRSASYSIDGITIVGNIIVDVGFGMELGYEILINGTITGNTFDYIDDTAIVGTSISATIRNNYGHFGRGETVTIAKIIDHANIVDDGGAAGHFDFTVSIPAFSRILSTYIYITEAFQDTVGNNTLVDIMVGDGTDDDRWDNTASPGQDIWGSTTDLAWAWDDFQGDPIENTGKTVRITFTTDSDITDLISGAGSQGNLRVYITYRKM